MAPGKTFHLTKELPGVQLRKPGFQFWVGAGQIQGLDKWSKPVGSVPVSRQLWVLIPLWSFSLPEIPGVLQIFRRALFTTFQGHKPKEQEEISPKGPRFPTWCLVRPRKTPKVERAPRGGFSPLKIVVPSSVGDFKTHKGGFGPRQGGIRSKNGDMWVPAGEPG